MIVSFDTITNESLERIVLRRQPIHGGGKAPSNKFGLEIIDKYLPLYFVFQLDHSKRVVDAWKI